MRRVYPAARPCLAVLFDLDGTLLDTAPDLAAALNSVRRAEGLDGLPLDRVRPYVSHGTRGLLQVGFGIGADRFETADASALRQRILDYYTEHLADATGLFPGIEALLARLEGTRTPWGIVTNKPSWLTNPLLDLLGLSSRAAVVVSGDTVSRSKPHPAPLLYAAERIGADPVVCLYIGDAARDIEAGRRAGMCTLVARYGYIGADDRPETWGADGVIDSPLEAMAWVGDQGMGRDADATRAASPTVPALDLNP